MLSMVAARINNLNAFSLQNWKPGEHRIATNSIKKKKTFVSFLWHKINQT